MQEITTSYMLTAAEQMAFVSAFLGGVSATILVTIAVLTKGRRVANLILITSALAACSLLISVIASLRLVIALHPDLPFTPEQSQVYFLWFSMINGYGLGVMSLLTSIGLSGWLRSKLVGVITSIFAFVGILFFVFASIFG
ncbi:hypothetical protein ISG33_11265 [Glaciecola sp. MH2013]|uniref:hypothetical protein n=1 Tax=Glaciecola sp. MH2013 TaxID=2785524 RepID=UPI00189C9A2A|nr:hypothetical protein [Glaciecola sp. MH2013]MBF7073979.1 hypothetical protein [Glaciecola sp. MH2013]